MNSVRQSAIETMEAIHKDSSYDPRPSQGKALFERMRIDGWVERDCNHNYLTVKGVVELQRLQAPRWAWLSANWFRLAAILVPSGLTIVVKFW